MRRSVKSKAVVCKAKPTVEVVEAELYRRVRQHISKARAKVYKVANTEMVGAYWNVGREIVEKQAGTGWLERSLPGWRRIASGFWAMSSAGRALRFWPLTSGGAFAGD